MSHCVAGRVCGVMSHCVAGLVVPDVSKDVGASIFSGQVTTLIIQWQNPDQMGAFKLHNHKFFVYTRSVIWSDVCTGKVRSSQFYSSSVPSPVKLFIDNSEVSTRGSQIYCLEISTL
jgi:hypothetical protein